MSNIVSPHLVPCQIKDFAEENVKKAFEVASSKLNVKLKFEGVKFFNKSTTAGYVIPSTDNLVYLNLELLKKNPDHFEKDTIPHEVAHLFARKIQLTNEGHHGRTWKFVMKNVYGLEPIRCHSLDTQGIGKKTKKFKYICNCKKHIVGSVRHNKMRSGKSSYRCASCLKTLTFLSKCD
jgi:SprT protein